MRTQRPLNIVRPMSALRCVGLLVAAATFGVVGAARVEAQVVAGDPIATAAFVALSRLAGSPQGTTVIGPVAVGPTGTRTAAASPFTVDPSTGLPQWTAEVVDLRSTPDPVAAAATPSLTYTMALDTLAVAVAARTGECDTRDCLELARVGVEISRAKPNAFLRVHVPHRCAIPGARRKKSAVRGESKRANPAE